MRKPTKTILAIAALACGAWNAPAVKPGAYINTISGEGRNLPPRYVLPMLSNGELSVHFDVQGTQEVDSYKNINDGVLWEGRRLGPPKDDLFSFGHFRQAIEYEGSSYSYPDKWTQTLDTRNAEMICENGYGAKLSVKTEIIVHADCDIVAIRKTFSTSAALGTPVRFKFIYDLSDNPASFNMPRRMFFEPSAAADGTIDIAYRAYGLMDYEGVISLGCDKDCAAVSARPEDCSMTVEVMPAPGKDVSVSFYAMYADVMSRHKYPREIASLKAMAREQGFEGLLGSHLRTWSERMGHSEINIPDEKLERAYAGGIYMLLASATRWSFPVGIGLWGGRFFAFDEAYCYLGLASSNHLDIARRAPEFRRKKLDLACKRTKDTGARFPWETMENGLEGAPQPYSHWYDHVFHMAHVTTECWTHYLYTCDREYLEKVAYPVMKECSKFFKLHMCHTHPDGSVTFGTTTDLERLGGAIENPFFSSCGAIYTFECTARAAAILGVDSELAGIYSSTAAELRKTLPRNDTMYIPYAGCEENSIAVTTGMYPYPVLSTDDPFERAAVKHFYDERYTSGNMYKLGSGLCPWYAGWIASAMAAYGERDKSLALLQEAASQIGYFSEHFEINEETVVRRPWFNTAAGNYVHALDQTLLLNRDDNVFLCYSAPIEWQDYSFTLPCYGNMNACVEVKDGKMKKCVISAAGWSGECAPKHIYIPEDLLKNVKLTKEAKAMMMAENGLCRFDISLNPGQSIAIVK